MLNKVTPGRSSKVVEADAGQLDNAQKLIDHKVKEAAIPV
jgi:hypothetical protein